MIRVIKPSIMNLDSAIEKLLPGEPEGRQCSFSLSAKSFTFVSEKAFLPPTTKVLETLYSSELSANKSSDDSHMLYDHIDGNFVEASFSVARAEIFTFFSYLPDEEGDLARIDGTELHARTVGQFWALVEKYVAIPPSCCFQYKPGKESYLKFFSGWSCSFLLLDAQAKHGIFIFLDCSPG